MYANLPNYCAAGSPSCKTRLFPFFRRSMVWMRNYTAQWMSCTCAICEILLEYQLLAMTYPPKVPIASNHYVYVHISIYLSIYLSIYIYILYYIHHFFWVWSIFNRIWSILIPCGHTLFLFALATKPPRLVLYLPSYEGQGAAGSCGHPWPPRGEIHPGAGDGHYNSAKISILPGCLGCGCLLENPRTQWVVLMGKSSSNSSSNRYNLIIYIYIYIYNSTQLSLSLTMYIYIYIYRWLWLMFFKNGDHIHSYTSVIPPKRIRETWSLHRLLCINPGQTTQRERSTVLLTAVDKFPLVI